MTLIVTRIFKEKNVEGGIKLKCGTEKDKGTRLNERSAGTIHTLILHVCFVYCSVKYIS